MRISDAPTMTGTRSDRRRAEAADTSPEAEARAGRETAGASFDSMGLSSRGFAGMLSELALGTDALVPSGSRTAVQSAFLEWGDPERGAPDFAMDDFAMDDVAADDFAPAAIAA